jgi:hypothetical protein
VSGTMDGLSGAEGQGEGVEDHMIKLDTFGSSENDAPISES